MGPPSRGLFDAILQFVDDSATNTTQQCIRLLSNFSVGIAAKKFAVDLSNPAAQQL